MWRPIHVDNYAEWILYAILIGIVVLVVYILMNYLFNRKDTMIAVDYVCGELKKKIKKEN